MALQMLLQHRMILSAEALDIMAYLKTAPGKFVSMSEISRRAGGRRKFEQSPGWAKNIIPPLMEAGLIQVNARGHFRVTESAKTKPSAAAQPAQPAPSPHRHPRGKILGDKYFPAGEMPRIVGGDYFPDMD